MAFETIHSSVIVVCSAFRPADISSQATVKFYFTSASELRLRGCRQPSVGILWEIETLKLIVIHIPNLNMGYHVLLPLLFLVIYIPFLYEFIQLRG